MKVTLLLVILCWLLPVRSSAQRNVLPGVGLGYEYGVPLALERSPGVINRYTFGGEGRSYNHTRWVGARVLLPRLFGEGFGVLCAADYALSSGQFRSVPFQGLVIQAGDTIAAAQEFTVASELELLRVELRASLSLTDWWRVEIGPWGSLRIGSELVQTEYLLDASARFPENNARERVVASGEPIASGLFRFGLGVSTSFDIRVARMLTMRPELSARIDAAAFDGNVGFRALSAGAGVSLYFDPDASPGSVDTAEAPVVTPPRKFLLEASVRLTSSDAEDSLTALVTSESTRYRHFMPLPPAIPFDSGSAAIPSRYALLAAAGESARFTRNSLARLSPLDLHHQILNILGLRLRAEPKGELTLIGHAARGESTELARERGMRTAAYLRDIWGIDSERITVKVGREPVLGAAERGVRIESNMPQVIAPIVSEWIVRDLYLPHIGLSRTIRAEAGVKAWELTIRQGEDTVSRFSSLDEERGETMDVLFRLRDGARAPAVPLIAELAVEDFTGARVVAADSMPVVRAGVDDARIVREVFSYTLAGYELNDPALVEGNRVLMENLLASIRDGARVTVVGDPEGTGWRGADVAEEILAGVRSRGVGPAELRLLRGDEESSSGEKLPERLLVAGACVTIEQPPMGDSTRSVRTEKERP